MSVVDDLRERIDARGIIFDARVAGRSDRHGWNYNAGPRHIYVAATPADHRDHIHFAVRAR